MLTYLVYQLKQLTYRRYLILWGLIGLVITHSSFVDKNSFLYNPPLMKAANWLYTFVAAVGFGWLIARNWHELDLRVDTYTILATLYIICAPFSVVINGTAGIDFGIDMILLPGAVGLIMTRVLRVRDVHFLLLLVVVFGMLNSLASFALIAKEGHFGPSHSSSFLISDRNGFIRYLAIVNAYCLILFFERVRRIRRIDFRAAALCAVMATVFCQVVLQFSRSGYLVYILSVGVITWFSGSKRLRRAYFFALPVIAALFTALVLFRIASEHSQVINISDLQRIALFKAGVNMIKHSPLTGLGYHISRTRIAEFADKAYPNDGVTVDIHNWFVNVWAEQGVFALVTFLLLNFGLMYSLYRLFRATPPGGRALALTCFTAILIIMVEGILGPNYDYESIYWIVIAASIIVLRDGTRAAAVVSADSDRFEGIRADPDARAPAKECAHQ